MGKRQITAAHSGKHKFNCFFRGERGSGAGTEIKQILNQLCQGCCAELTGAMSWEQWTLIGGRSRQVVETGHRRHAVVPWGRQRTGHSVLQVDSRQVVLCTTGVGEADGQGSHLDLNNNGSITM